MGTLFNREPAMFLGVIQAGLALAIGFGLHLSPEQFGLLMAFSAAVLAWITRSQVTPTKKD
jgi:hypothetical protein